jgi:hypothetical protein
MATVDIRLGYKDSAWFAANPTLVLKGVISKIQHSFIKEFI